MNIFSGPRRPGNWLALIALAITTIVYWPGLTGGWIFDDYPNIVDNSGVHIKHASVSSLARAVLSSPSSEFKRPLASLSFALNYLVGGLDPYSWKLFNVLIHLLNGVLVYGLARMLLRVARQAKNRHFDENDTVENMRRDGIVAALIAAAWMLLPINLTAVLYVVQRMESMANLFVLAGLIGYVAGRLRMLSTGRYVSGFIVSTASLCLCMAVGVLAKETAVMLPLYAFLIEAILFRFGRTQPTDTERGFTGTDRRVILLFVLVLAIPMILGLAWQIPHILRPEDWANRDFTLRTRLLSEARIVSAYIAWTILPLPHWLSFYHDNYKISTGLLHPWTTLAGMAFLLALVALAWRLRKSRPLVSLGIALYLGCHLLTGTVLPLELVFEHRNYFASFGLMLALVPLLAAPRSHVFALPRRTLLGGLLVIWSSFTMLTAAAWGNPLSMAQELAARAPDSPRAQYGLGRTYIVYSHYDPNSPFTPLVYAPLERAAKLPNSSILPEQALIFFNARMHRPIKEMWWRIMIAKLTAHDPGVQDESSLAALTKCARSGACDLPESRMLEAFHAALSHPHPSSRLLANFGDYAWNVLGDHELGLQMTRKASATSPDVPAYHITLTRMYVVLGQFEEAHQQVAALERLDFGGRLDGSIANLRKLIPSPRGTP